MTARDRASVRSQRSALRARRRVRHAPDVRRTNSANASAYLIPAAMRRGKESRRPGVKAKRLLAAITKPGYSHDVDASRHGKSDRRAGAAGRRPGGRAPRGRVGGPRPPACRAPGRTARSRDRMTSNGGKLVIAEHSVIVARGLGVRRGGRWLLRPVTFGVPEGVVGLAGPPGAGKSTLLATFATLRRPDAGALHVLGHDVAHAAGVRAARAGVGYLPARFSRAEHMTAGNSSSTRRTTSGRARPPRVPWCGGSTSARPPARSWRCCRPTSGCGPGSPPPASTSPRSCCWTTRSASCAPPPNRGPPARAAPDAGR